MQRKTQNQMVCNAGSVPFVLWCFHIIPLQFSLLVCLTAKIYFSGLFVMFGCWERMCSKLTALLFCVSVRVSIVSLNYLFIFKAAEGQDNPASSSQVKVFTSFMITYVCKLFGEIMVFIVLCEWLHGIWPGLHGLINDYANSISVQYFIQYDGTK